MKTIFGKWPKAYKCSSKADDLLIDLQLLVTLKHKNEQHLSTYKAIQERVKNSKANLIVTKKGIRK
jgi:hypothetical protein